MSTSTTSTKTKRTGAEAFFPAYRSNGNFDAGELKLKRGDLVDVDLSLSPNERLLVDQGLLIPLAVDAAAKARHQLARLGRRNSELDGKAAAARATIESGLKEEAAARDRLVEVEELIAEGERLRKRIVGIRDERNTAERVLELSVPTERARLARLRAEAEAVLEQLGDAS